MEYLLFSKLKFLNNLIPCIFVECNDEIRDKRRIARDTVERGATLDMVTHQLNTTVNPMFYKHVFPNRHYADIVFNNSENGSTYSLHKKLLELYKKVIEYLENPNTEEV